MTNGSGRSRPGASRLPALGPRGEGWVALQVLALGAVGLAGLLGPMWEGLPRTGTTLIGSAGIATGGLMAAWAMRSLGSALTPLPRPGHEATLVETGPFARVRHPIYGGLVIAGAGWGLLTASLPAVIAAVGLLAFFDLKSRREETWLVERFPAYPAYRKRTRRLLPWVY